MYQNAEKHAKKIKWKNSIYLRKKCVFLVFFFSDCYVEKFIKYMPSTLHKETKRHYEEYVLLKKKSKTNKYHWIWRN